MEFRFLPFVLTIAFVFVSASLWSAPAAGQSDPSQPPSPPPREDAAIKGVITDQDGNAVEGVRVSAYSNAYPCCYAYATEGTTTTSPSGDGSSGSAGSADSAPPDEKIAPDRPYYGGENVTISDADGRYFLGVFSGGNSLSFSKDGYAYANFYVEAVQGQTVSQDVKLQKFPDKTAHIEGRIVDAKGNAVRFTSININSPQFGVYECSVESGSDSSPSGATEPASLIYPYPGPYNPGCSIRMDSDGSFEGDVTPGYSIISVWHDSYRACPESRDADGSSSRVCGPEYFGWTQSRDLPADATTELRIVLTARPATDSVVSGYLVDAESGQAIPGAQISFSNDETYGYGYATTDGDGSYKLRLRAGYHHVYASTEGHFRWEGIVQIEKGDNDFDVKLVSGQESYGGYGGCCYGGGGIAYAEGAALKASGASMTSTASGAPAPGAASESSDSLAAESASRVYEDLGGGLGPYDPNERSANLEKDSPSAGLALIATLTLVAAALRRRK